MTVLITEDQALMLKVPLQSLVDEWLQAGYRISSTYIHPAVGLVYVFEPDYSLAG